MNWERISLTRERGLHKKGRTTSTLDDDEQELSVIAMDAMVVLRECECVECERQKERVGLSERGADEMAVVVKETVRIGDQSH